MFAADEYNMLLTSLPAYHSLFAAHLTPISRRKLDARLQLLSDEHRHLLSSIEKAMCWDNTPLNAPIEAASQRFQRLLTQLSGSSLSNFVHFRFAMRTVTYALLQRHYESPLPTSGWTSPALERHIIQHWQQPAFNLQGRFPWLTELEQKLHDEDWYGIEKLLLHLSWQNLQRQPCRQFYSFEAVVIYVLKWDIIERWTSYHADQAEQRFHELLDAALPTRDWLATIETPTT